MAKITVVRTEVREDEGNKENNRKLPDSDDKTVGAVLGALLILLWILL